MRSLRHAAIECLIQLDAQNYQISDLINSAVSGFEISPIDVPLLNELVYGTIRWRGKIDWILSHFVEPHTKKNPELINVLRIGVYQLCFLDRVPPHAAINETVKLIKQRKLKNFVNAVLRSVQRKASELKPPTISESPIGHLAIETSFPKWLIRRWIEQHGLKWTDQFCRASNRVAPLSIRTNTLRTTRDDLLDQLRDRNAITSQIASEGIRVSSFRDLDEIDDQLFQVQDESAQLIAHLADPKPDQKIVDLCASPGGKTTHLAQLLKNGGEITAIDLSMQKVAKISENCRRLGITNVRTKIADATIDEIPEISTADVVLVDVPCSGFGTIRRHPDIRWNKSRDGLIQLAKLQSKILDRTADQLRSGGVLIYSTCTTEIGENQNIVNNFLTKHSDFEIENASDFISEWIVTDEGFLQTFPQTHDVDGSFAARLRKIR